MFEIDTFFLQFWKTKLSNTLKKKRVTKAKPIYQLHWRYATSGRSRGISNPCNDLPYFWFAWLIPVSAPQGIITLISVKTFTIRAYYINLPTFPHSTLTLGCTSLIAKTIGLTSIRHRFDMKVSDRCLIDIDLMAFVIWDITFQLSLYWWVMQDTCNSSANTLELRLSCTSPSYIYCMFQWGINCNVICP